MQTVPSQGDPGAEHRGNDSESGGSDSGGGGDAPFAEGINPQALYPHEAFQDVLAELAQAKISDREGATLITGALGAGKTSLIARLLAEAERAEGSLRLAGSEDLTFSRFLRLCAEGFGLPAEFANAKDHLKALSAFLVERARSGRSSTIVIDPADNLNARFLGELSEFATWSKAGRRLSNVILVGQGTSGGQAGPKFAGVKIALHCHLQPLPPEEVRLYLAHHLRLADASRPDLLSPDVVACIAEISGGLPGKINELARAALWAAPAGTGVDITPELVREAAHLLEAGGATEDEEAALRPAAPAATAMSLPDSSLPDDLGTAQPAVEDPLADRRDRAAWTTPLRPDSGETGTSEAAGAMDGGPQNDRAEAGCGGESIAEEADRQAWPLDLSMADSLADKPDDRKANAPEAEVLPRSRPRRARRLWLGLGASGLAAGLLLAAAVHETWPKKIVGLMEDYEIVLPSIDELAERFNAAVNPGTEVAETEAPAAGMSTAADAGSVGQSGDQCGGLAVSPVSFTAEVGREDEPLRLQVYGNLEGGNDITQIAITIAGLPPGARLSAGTRDKTGLWHLEADDLRDLSLLPPTDYAGDFGLAVSVASQVSGGEVTYATQAMPIHIKAVPDVPLLRVGKAMGEQGEPLPLDIDAKLVDQDGSEILTLFVSGLPDGARLSAGKRQGDGSWQLEPRQAKDLRLIPPSDLSGSFTITVMALASERNGGSVPAKLPLSVKIEPSAAAPLLTLAPVAGREGEPLSLALAASLAEGEDAEGLYLLFEGLPAGAKLSAGRDIGEGVWRVEEEALTGLKILPPAGWSGGFDLEVTAVAMGRDGGEARVSDKAPVRFDAPSKAAAAPIETAAGQAQDALQAEAKLPSSEQPSQLDIGGDFDIATGDSLLASKDLAAARRYLQQGADQGIPKAMTAMGTTYDPQELARLGIAAEEGDSNLARHWYLRGVAAGDLEAMK
ncbi:MAG TPA: ATP-binding protein, partial [Kiloniellaceae bacterium]|nr:ATP-binding protein [Kiloniellaceae bacterium]